MSDHSNLPADLATHSPDDPSRRMLLQAATMLAASQVAGGVLAAEETFHGKPGDFDFLAGEWRIDHRRLTAPGEWDRFEGEATCWSILSGVASIEELRIPARNFSGMGLRLLDVEKRIWSDFWVNASSGVLTTPGPPFSRTAWVPSARISPKPMASSRRVSGIELHPPHVAGDS